MSAYWHIALLVLGGLSFLGLAGAILLVATFPDMFCPMNDLAPEDDPRVGLVRKGS